MKNRYSDKLPCKETGRWGGSISCDDDVVHVCSDNLTRARLRPTGEEGSDYINASFVDVSQAEVYSLLNPHSVPNLWHYITLHSVPISWHFILPHSVPVVFPFYK